jgi:nitroreductase
MPEILDIIMKRRSIRKFTDQSVPKEVLVQLLQAAMSAPSAVNSQPWQFVVVDEPEAMQKLRAVLVYGKYNAPAAIIVCGSPKTAKNPASTLFWVQDCSAALENILIAAAGMGLGTVWIGVYPIPTNIAQVRSVAKLPRSVTPLGVVYIGYSAENIPSRTQYDETKVHWQYYENKKP